MRRIQLLILFAVFCSCSMLEKMAVKTTGGVIYNGSDELLTEGNYQNFLKGAPANLKLIEGLWYSDQENQKLLTLLIKGYGAYGFAAMETEALEDILQDKKTLKVDQVLLNYQKAINYGIKYLELKGISKEKFWDKAFPENVGNVFNSKLAEDDYVAIFYFAQSLGSSINLQRTNVKKMAFMNHVQKMFDWVCKKDPTIERGSCQLFDAVFLASLPSILGGSQNKARAAFKKMIKAQPYNLLAHQSYIQYHIVPMMEEDEFVAEMKKLKNNIDTWFDLQLGTTSKKSKLYEANKLFNLYNSIARERYYVLKKLQNELL